MKDLK